MKLSGFIFLFALFARPVMASSVYGLWYPPGKDSKINIADCGDGTPCGTIVWIKTESGNSDTVLDSNNPDPALRDRPMVGLIMVKGFKESKKGWKKGRIYDPGSGKSYRSVMHAMDDGTLKVKGCIGPICQAQVWTPVTQDSE